MSAAVWRGVAGFPDYEVSDQGGVRRVTVDRRGHAPRDLRPWPNNKCYAVITLTSTEGVVRKLLVSRMVCEAFHGPPPTPKHQCAHGDGDQSNNRATNLRWATRSENMADTVLHGTQAKGPTHGRTTKPHRTPRGERHGHAKLSAAQVDAIRATPRSPGSGRALAAEHHVSPATISMIRNGRTWTPPQTDERKSPCP